MALAAAFAVIATSGDLSADRVRDWVQDAGVWAPLVFVALSASLTVVLFPGPLLAGASGLLFGTAVERRAGPRVRRLRAAIGRRGFVAVLYARILPGIPYNLVNYAAGLAPIRLATFAAATALGAAPRAFAYTALGGSCCSGVTPTPDAGRCSICRA